MVLLVGLCLLCFDKEQYETRSSMINTVYSVVPAEQHLFRDIQPFHRLVVHDIALGIN